MKPFLFDLDGVLARFTDGAFKHHGIPPEPVTTWNFHHKHGITDAQFYVGMDVDFWAGLGRWEDGFALLDAVIKAHGVSRIAFLTSPCQTSGCEEGKRRWAIQHLKPLGFDPWGDVFIGGNKAKLAHRDAVLIEDSDTNYQRWIAAGGLAWLIPRLWNGCADWCVPGSDGLFDAEYESRKLLEWYGGLK